MLSCLSQQETGTTGNNVVLGEGAVSLRGRCTGTLAALLSGICLHQSSSKAMTKKVVEV